MSNTEYRRAERRILRSEPDDYPDDEYEEEYESDEYQGDDAHQDGGSVNEEPLPNPYSVPEVEDLLEEAIEMLAEARPLPMSNTVKVNRDELLHLLEQAQERLPEELRAARWLLKERDDFVARARQEHQDLIDEGRAQVGRMVERQQVVKAAEHRSRQIVAEATEEANTIKRQVEDYCDQRLASFEQILARTAGTVKKGRQRLLGTALTTTEEIISAAAERNGRIDLVNGEHGHSDDYDDEDADYDDF